MFPMWSKVGGWSTVEINYWHNNRLAWSTSIFHKGKKVAGANGNNRIRRCHG